ncbi:hypothetical protein Sme01_36500 [Sphaerisporangium melleum]|uniref:Uncharacterized protein n=1 Tax=Sphaerisporangium melleum TaxID=321316 RepID=A0A917RP65_9ACTN|nr:hypothetical protein [Sphaerisporangium melleum]GGL16467.1 hypothetical protein GCM10007964_68050 [Sphaerisporangium melleum]GII71174.1 hypothetical protein Sme01_36500 [Sphaerisporangium melleum]
MSGAFLYLGIVLMWLCVLVPMWLRRDRHTLDADLYAGGEEFDGDTLADVPVPEVSGGAPGADPADDEITMEIGPSRAGSAHPHDPSAGLDASDGAQPIGATPPIPDVPSDSRTTSGAGAASAPDSARRSLAGPGTARSLATPAAVDETTPQAATSTGDAPDEYEKPASEPDETAVPGAAVRRGRARVLARRRRWLLFSLLLHIASVVTAAVGVAPWWSVAPSAVLLPAYLVILRVATAVDRERRLAAAEAQAEQRRRARERRQALELAAQQAEAEIIEFRRRAEPFDQYADRSRRAVGD